MVSQPTLPHPRTTAPHPGIWLARLAYTTLFVGIIFCASAVLLWAGYAANYQGRIYPGVYVWGTDLSGLKPEEAALTLATAFAYPQAQAIIFRDGDEQWPATPAQLGLTFDVIATVREAYAIGRSGDVVADIGAQGQAWYSGFTRPPVLIYDAARTEAYLIDLAAQTQRPVIEAALNAEGTTVTTAPGQIGRQLNVAEVVAQTRVALLSLSNTEVTLAFVETPPLVLDASAQAAAAQALLSQPLVLILATPLTDDVTTSWAIEPATLAAWLRIQRIQDTANSARYDVALDPEALRPYLEPLAEPLKREPSNARFVFNDETQQLEVIQASVPARTLDIDATLEQIAQAIARGEHAVGLALNITQPEAADTTTAAELGITELVSLQSTYFIGSSAERLNNVQVAAARFHGLLVPPNATFSFDEHLGDVSLDSGFAEALIIFGGRTIRGVGGGVCQVSTTVFRAAYFGGYPIEERWSHAYRVGYYERGDPGGWSGPGLDATVFAPLVDFKFTNDTPYWLLMEVYVNPAAGRITWKFYSTSDGRAVQVSAAQVENQVPAPDPLYEEDAALAPGEIKQVDYAAVGADVTIYRTITRNGQVINASEPPLTTHYQPWRAIYHYGPGTENMPPAPTPPPTP